LTFWYSNAGYSLGPIQEALIGGNRSWVNTNPNGDFPTIGFSQALGFNLGLASFTNTPSNLMQQVMPITTVFESLHLNDQQRAIISQSRFVEEIAVSETTVPPAAFLFATVLAGGGLVCRQRRKRKQFVA